MNIQSITALAEQLNSLGFEDFTYLLVKRICFKPYSFTIFKKIIKGKDHCIFNLYFESDRKRELYILKYYDAVLQKEMPVVKSAINGIDIFVLEKRMAEIDWKTAFDFEMKNNWTPEDKKLVDQEKTIELIVDDLSSLESMEAGKTIAAGLKLKYWAGIPNYESICKINLFKIKDALSQRFYFFEDQHSISVDEVFRFLHNMWLEKHLQAKRKDGDGKKEEEYGNSGRPLIANGTLLKKKRFNKPKNGRGNMKNQN